MASNTIEPKNILPNILFLLYFAVVIIPIIIILSPFIILSNIISIPFTKRLINKLPATLENNWLPRKKYIYIGMNGKSALSDFVKNKIIRDYGEYIVWDEWDEEKNEMTRSEPDDSRRIETFWNCIGQCDSPRIIIASYQPDDFIISANRNFYQFWLKNNGEIYHCGKIIITKDAEYKIESIIEKTLEAWHQSDSKK